MKLTYTHTRVCTCVCVLILFLCSCSTTKKMIEQKQTETLTEQADTIYIERIVYEQNNTNTQSHVKEKETEKTTVKVNEAGDTIRIDHYIEIIKDTEILKENERLKAELDSISNTHINNINHQTDNVDIQIIEKQLTKWQSFRINAFWYLIGIIAGFTLYTFRRFIFRR